MGEQKSGLIKNKIKSKVTASRDLNLDLDLELKVHYFIAELSILSY